MSVRSVIVASVLLCFSSLGFASDWSTEESASLPDVKMLIPLAGLDKIVLSNVRRTINAQNLQGDNPINSDIYLTYLTTDAISERIAPVVAKHMSPELTKKVVAAFNTPMGRLSVKLRLLAIISGQSAAQAEFFRLPKSEQRALNEFNSSGIFKAFLAAETKVAPDVGKVLKQWDDEVVRARTHAVRLELANIVQHVLEVDRLEDVGDTSLVLAQKISRTGIVNFDKEAYASFRYIYRNAKLTHQLRQKIEKINMADILKPENLVSPRMLEAGSLAVLSAESLIADYMKLSETQLSEFQFEIDNIKMSPEAKRALNARTAEQFRSQMDIQLRAAENQRALFEVVKRILVFCENRVGKVVVSEGLLRFNTDEDVDAYNALFNQLKKEQAEFLRLEKEDFERRETIVKKLKIS